VVGDELAATTTAYTDEIIRNLGRKSERWQVREPKPLQLPQVTRDPVMVRPQTRRVVGMDVFVEFDGTPEQLGKSLEQLAEGSPLKLKMVSSRGTMVYPVVGFMTDLVDHWRCRFILRYSASAASTAGHTSRSYTSSMGSRASRKRRARIDRWFRWLPSPPAPLPRLRERGVYVDRSLAGIGLRNRVPIW
jgi:hypothetical protein